jgi:hypothetical protein
VPDKELYDRAAVIVLSLLSPMLSVRVMVADHCRMTIGVIWSRDTAPLSQYDPPPQPVQSPSCTIFCTKLKYRSVAGTSRI